MRLFVAISPAATLRQNLAKWARTTGTELPNARWVPAQNLHVTLRFLGTVDELLIGSICSALARAVKEHSPMRLQLGSLATLPRRSRARVASMGIEHQIELASLRVDVARSVEAVLALEPDNRPFHPHVTLARTRRPWSRATGARWTRLPCPHQGALFEVTYVDLMESVSSPSGALYRSIKRFPLGE